MLFVLGASGLGFRVYGVEGLGFRVQGLGYSGGGGGVFVIGFSRS